MKMFVRYIGNRVCWTVDGGRFYMGYREELTEAEKFLCDRGGGHLPLSLSVDAVAR
jgi:hypothetical protein